MPFWSCIPPLSASRPSVQETGQRRDVISQQTYSNHSGQTMRDREKTIEFANLDDSALLATRARMRAKLERLAPHSIAYAELSARYDLSTQEIDDRARKAWSQAR